MSISIDYNDIETRIRLLYDATDNYLGNVSDIKPKVLSLSVEKSPGKVNISMKVGAPLITNEDELRIMSVIIQIIDQLANLKDNTKKALASLGESFDNPSKLVEDYISSHQELSILTDLDNQNKHGYPLTRREKSMLSPKIENIRNEMIAPIHFEWTDVFNDGKVIFEADIVDKDGSFVISFRKLIDKCISLWEDFYIQNLPTKSDEIKARKDRKAIWSSKLNEFTKLGKEVKKEIHNINNWQAIGYTDNLRKGMFLLVFDLDTRERIFGGMSTSEIYLFELKKTIEIYNIFEFGLKKFFPIDSYLWMVFNPSSNAILEKARFYYSQFHVMNKLASQGKFGDQ